MKKTYGKKLLGALAVGTLALAAVTSQAATVILDGTGTNATGIDGLVVDGTTYDVTFSTTTANLLYGPQPFEYQFPGTVPSQNALQEALVALNGSAAVTVGSFAEIDFYIGFDLAPSEVKIKVKRGLYVSGPPNNTDAWITGEEGQALSFGTVATYADFQVAAVPVPAAAWLFGSALMGLVGLKRKNGA